MRIFSFLGLRGLKSILGVGVLQDKIFSGSEIVQSITDGLQLCEKMVVHHSAVINLFRTAAYRELPSNIRKKAQRLVNCLPISIFKCFINFMETGKIFFPGNKGPDSFRILFFQMFPFFFQKSLSKVFLPKV